MKLLWIFAGAALLLGAAISLPACGDEPSENAQTVSTVTSTSVRATDDVFGRGLSADLGIYLSQAITDDEMTALISGLLHETTPGREGEAMIEGVHRVQGDYGVKAIYVDFENGTSSTRIDEIVTDVSADPAVIDTRRDVVVGE